MMPFYCLFLEEKYHLVPGLVPSPWPSTYYPQLALLFCLSSFLTVVLEYIVYLRKQSDLLLFYTFSSSLKKFIF